MMKEYFYNNSLSSFFYEHRGNDVVIISRGVDSPFEHLDIIYSLLDSFKTKKINVFFDFALLSGLSEERFVKLLYSDNRFNLRTKTYLNEKTLPADIKKMCNNFYRKHSKDLINNCFISDYKKQALKEYFSC